MPPTPAPPPVPADTPVTDTVAPLPPPPTADQMKYLRGLRTAARGVAQLRSGVDNVSRADGTRDSLRLRRAGRMLSGLCGTARTFMRQGRATMQPTVYDDSLRLKARRLTFQVDSLLAVMPGCETNAAAAPTKTAAGLVERLRAYEEALQDFRTATTSPVPATSP
jgi:hypothetical protein